jgi:hypothetical protein
LEDGAAESEDPLEVHGGFLSSGGEFLKENLNGEAAIVSRKSFT